MKLFNLKINIFTNNSHLFKQFILESSNKIIIASEITDFPSFSMAYVAILSSSKDLILDYKIYQLCQPLTSFVFYLILAHF